MSIKNILREQKYPIKKSKRNDEDGFDVLDRNQLLKMGAVATQESSTDGEESYKLEYKQWVLNFIVADDYIIWVDSFTATHPTFGSVKGSVEKWKATSNRAMTNFERTFDTEWFDFSEI